MALNEFPLKVKKKDWRLTQEGFDRLLRLLDPDREVAATRYEQLRLRLIKLFEWRGSPTPEEHTDEAFDRLARKIVEGVEVQDVAHFLGGIARRLCFEIIEQREREQKALKHIPEPAMFEIRDDEIDPRIDCFRRCLESLPAAQRALIVDYYRVGDLNRIQQRKRLADDLGVPLNALRIRAHRLRVQLDRCIRDCLKQ